MSFKYPKEWNVIEIEDYGSHGESVTLKSPDNQSVSIFIDPNTTLENTNVIIIGTFGAEPVETKTIGGVPCMVYVMGPVRFYSFDKNGSAFMIITNEMVAAAAESIIASIEAE